MGRPWQDTPSTSRPSRFSNFKILDLTQTAFGFKNGRMYSAADVPSGLSCGCTCVGCGATLVAKKGRRVRWHFAHHKVKIGATWAESAIHAAAKQVLLEQNWLRVPEKRVSVFGKANSGEAFEESAVLAEERIVRFDRSSPEVWEEGVRPDVVGYRGGRKLGVEMYFRHQVDDSKRHKLAQLMLPTIEVNLSDLDVSTGIDAIAQRVLHKTAHKAWLFYPNEDRERLRLQSLLAARIERANKEYERKKASERKREATRELRLDEEQHRRETAAERYRQLSNEEKENDLRKRLGIAGPWPYYLCKQGNGTSALAEPAMIWQAALFSRFVFKKANPNFELKQGSVLQWVGERFEKREGATGALDGEVRRYLGYLAACGFLDKLSYNPYESQGYTVVHGELEPPARNQRKAAAAWKPLVC